MYNDWNFWGQNLQSHERGLVRETVSFLRTRTKYQQNVWKKKEELTDYMDSIISRISDDGDQMGLRKKLYQYYEERDTNFELNQIILKKPSLVAMVILLDFYKMLTKDKNMSLKKKLENKNKIKIFQCSSLKKRTTMYQISNSSKKKMKHRCIWRVFMEIEKSRKT